MSTEKSVAGKLVKAILETGCTISIHEGEDWAISRSTSQSDIYAALNSTGEDTIFARNSERKLMGTFSLVWGNEADGSELISDHTDNDFCNAIAATIR